ncbi:cytochrome P450 [Crucibulum laeve]|uniref:Cytochrome P450 n=1 Tax=Crucibulum laeve TaxID=68775 RepID=A0A5C3M3V2_9AGAR|nr:cytochrome P450 [Crucibulum laeve]
MVKLTPGLAFLLHHLLLPSLAYLGILLLSRFFSVQLPIPGGLLLPLCFLSVPLRVILGVILKERAEAREAEAMGARLAPRAQGKRMGNYDVLVWLMGCWRNGYPGDGIRDLVAELGPVFNSRILWANMIFTVSPECIKLILTDSDHYVKGERFRTAMGSVLGNGVFNSDGDMWKFHRSMTRPFFTRDRIGAFALFDRHASLVITRIKEKMSEGEAIDFQDLMLRFTLDSGTDHLFGSCVNSLSTPASSLPSPYSKSSSRPVTTSRSSTYDDLSDPNAFSDAFQRAQIIIAERERLGWMWPLREIFKDYTEEPMRVVNGYLDRVVSAAIAQRKAREDQVVMDGKNGLLDEEESETLLGHLIGQTEDPALLKEEALNILIAARDTMAATLTFAIYFLCLHPDVMNKLRAEILAKVGPTRMPGFEDVKDLRYLKAVINETLRLLPPVPFNVRESTRSTTWPSPDPNKKPIYIPAGSATSYSVLMMHTRKDLWGPDADQFDPDRFIDERFKKYLLPNPFIFLPFNAGPRICLGQQFAYNQVSFVLIRLLQSFASFSLCPEAFPPDARPPADWKNAEGESRKAREQFRPHIILTMSSKGGMWVKAREAESDA